MTGRIAIGWFAAVLLAGCAGTPEPQAPPAAPGAAGPPSAQRL